MQIVNVVAEDLLYLAQLDAETFSENERWNLEEFESWFDEPDKYWIKLVDDDKIIGWSAIVVNDGIGELLNISVIPEWRGKGLGSLLLTNIFAWSWMKCDKIIAQVRVDNEASKSLLKRAGFHMNSYLKDYYTQDLDAIEYIREL